MLAELCGATASPDQLSLRATRIKCELQEQVYELIALTFLQREVLKLISERHSCADVASLRSAC